MNLDDATIAGSEVVFGQLRAPLDPVLRPRADGRVILGIRPEAFEDASFASPELPVLDVTTVVLEEPGSDAHVFFRVDAERAASGALESEVEEAADLVVDRGSLLNARVDPRTTARVGGDLRLAVDPSRFHFFDAATGESLTQSAVALPPPEVPAPELAR
jgi:multiple sugar transport system ATP-binding protein